MWYMNLVGYRSGIDQVYQNWVGFPGTSNELGAGQARVLPSYSDRITQIISQIIMVRQYFDELIDHRPVSTAVLK